MSRPKKPFGETHVRVAANVRHIRQSLGMSSYALADRVRQLGGAIDQAGIARLETCQRRIDVDDLAVLARALNVDPGRLLTEVAEFSLSWRPDTRSGTERGATEWRL